MQFTEIECQVSRSRETQALPQCALTKIPTTRSKGTHVAASGTRVQTVRLTMRLLAFSRMDGSRQVAYLPLQCKFVCIDSRSACSVRRGSVSSCSTRSNEDAVISLVGDSLYILEFVSVVVRLFFVAWIECTFQFSTHAHFLSLRKIVMYLHCS